MVSTGGDRLISPDAVALLVDQLFPLATVLTPNLSEAEFLVGRRLRSREDLEQAAQDIQGMGPLTVLIKGGHFEHPDSSMDIFFDGDEVHCLRKDRIETTNTHGSGCTLAAAIAAYLAQGLSIRNSVVKAKDFVQKAIQSSYPLGKGNGPLGHFLFRDSR
jgi:hydroxymethylpyrimidine/phosphomethylpyrimidine kinase